MGSSRRLTIRSGRSSRTTQSITLDVTELDQQVDDPVGQLYQPEGGFAVHEPEPDDARLADAHELERGHDFPATSGGVFVAIGEAATARGAIVLGRPVGDVHDRGFGKVLQQRARADRFVVRMRGDEQYPGRHQLDGVGRHQVVEGLFRLASGDVEAGVAWRTNDELGRGEGRRLARLLRHGQLAGAGALSMSGTRPRN